MTRFLQFASLVLLLAIPALPATAQRARSASGSPGVGGVLAERKISNHHGGFPDTLDEHDGFGGSAAALGDLNGDGIPDVAVTAPGDRFGDLTTEGAVWVLFLNADGTVRDSQRINGREGGFGGDPDATTFATSVAVPGDVDGDGVVDLAVGIRTNYPWDPNRGLWILLLNADGTVKAEQKISTIEGGFTGQLASQDQFGLSVGATGDVDGDGTPDVAAGSPDGRGKVWILFLNPDGTVKGQQKIGRDAGGFTGTLSSGDRFGFAISSIGDLDGNGVNELAVGAPYDDERGNDRGAVWILFLQADGTVLDQRKLFDELPGSLPKKFGRSLAPLEDRDGNGVGDLAVGTDEHPAGALRILMLEGDGTSDSQLAIPFPALEPGASTSQSFGAAVAAIGDLDGDGDGDLVVGEPYGAQSIGSVWALTLEQDGQLDHGVRIDDHSPGFEGTLDQSDGFGCSVAFLGDLDGDGVGDVAVGASRDDDGRHENGAVWIQFLRPNGSVKSWAKISDTEGVPGPFLPDNARLGFALAALGDVDGDGVVDLAASAPRPGNLDPKGFWIFFLRTDGSVRDMRWISSPSGDWSDGFGDALTGLGDLDGDGVVDIAVGARSDDDGDNRAGAVWILFLSANGTVDRAQKISALAGGFQGALGQADLFGTAVCALRDRETGTLELAVGAPGDDDGVLEGGAVWLLSLNPDGTVASHAKLSRTEGLPPDAVQGAEQLGLVLASPDDVDGNGTVDLAVADPTFFGSLRESRLWILFRNADGSVSGYRRIGRREGGLSGRIPVREDFGSALAPLGDFDADGVVDLLVGESNSHDGGYSHGALWLLRLDGVAHVGFETGDDVARTPLGNGRAVGAPFGTGAPVAFGRTLSITGSGPGLGAAVFDASPLGPNAGGPDPDLLVGGGNVLVLQDGLHPAQSVPGVFDVPDDDFDGGALTIVFPAPVEPLDVELIDIDPGLTELAHVTLTDEAGQTRTYTAPAGWTEDITLHGLPGSRTLDLRTLDPQPGFLATATVWEDALFDSTRVVRIEVVLGSSGAIDDLRWEPTPKTRLNPTASEKER